MKNDEEGNSEDDDAAEEIFPVVPAQDRMSINFKDKLLTVRTMIREPSDEPPNGAVWRQSEEVIKFSSIVAFRFDVWEVLDNRSEGQFVAVRTTQTDEPAVKTWSEWKSYVWFLCLLSWLCVLLLVCSPVMGTIFIIFTFYSWRQQLDRLFSVTFKLRRYFASVAVEASKAEKPRPRSIALEESKQAAATSKEQPGALATSGEPQLLQLDEQSHKNETVQLLSFVALASPAISSWALGLFELVAEHDAVVSFWLSNFILCCILAALFALRSTLVQLCGFHPKFFLLQRGGSSPFPQALCPVQMVYEEHNISVMLRHRSQLLQALVAEDTNRLDQLHPLAFRPDTDWRVSWYYARFRRMVAVALGRQYLTHPMKMSCGTAGLEGFWSVVLPRQLYDSRLARILLFYTMAYAFPVVVVYQFVAPKLPFLDEWWQAIHKAYGRSYLVSALMYLGSFCSLPAAFVRERIQWAFRLLDNPPFSWIKSVFLPIDELITYFSGKLRNLRPLFQAIQRAFVQVSPIFVALYSRLWVRFGKPVNRLVNYCKNFSKLNQYEERAKKYGQKLAHNLSPKRIQKALGMRPSERKREREKSTKTD